ncbi:MAG: hypothetical protein ABF289_05995 [Clostridiales bacterium]
MSIKSIDFQSMYTRTNDIAKIKNDLQNRNLNLLQYQTKTIKDNIENNLSQVTKREKAQEALIKDKNEKNQEKKKKKRNKNLKEDTNEESILDIRI